MDQIQQTWMAEDLRRAALRVVIAYRPDWEQSRCLVAGLGRFEKV